MKAKALITIVALGAAVWSAYLRVRNLNRILEKYQLELVDDELIEALCLVAASAKANTKK